MSTTSPESHVNRIQALLNKAESSQFPDEAEALLAKAQQLMARHAIDEAMLAGPADEIVDEQIIVQAPYASAKSSLLGSVVRANRCRVVMAKGPSGTEYCTVVGHRSDIANVGVLFNALSLQAVRFMLAATVPPNDTPRRFRHTFLLSYASRIGQRLAEADQAAAAEAQQEQFDRPSGPSVSLVLASREAKVEQALNAKFPNLRTRKVSMSSSAGYHSGRAAADQASLNKRIGGSGRSLPSG